MVTKLKVEKAQVEASLREEEAKCGMLLKEVKDSNEVRCFMWCKVRRSYPDAILFCHLENLRRGCEAQTFLSNFMQIILNDFDLSGE